MDWNNCYRYFAFSIMLAGCTPINSNQTSENSEEKKKDELVLSLEGSLKQGLIQRQVGDVTVHPYSKVHY